MGDVAGGRAKNSKDLRRVEVGDVPEIIVVIVVPGVLSAPGQQHECHAVCQDASELNFNIEIVQFFQECVSSVLAQLREIVRHIILDGVLCGRYKCLGKGVLIRQFPEAVFQGFRDLGLIFRAHAPDGHGTRKSTGVGVGNIEIIFKPGTALVLPVKDGDAGSSTVDPAPKLPVPFFNLQHGGGVWALGIDQKLFLERKPIVAAGGGQKLLPLLGRSDFPLRPLVQLGQKFCSSRHVGGLPPPVVYLASLLII